MSRPVPLPTGAAADARAQLPHDAQPGFDRLARAVLASPGAARQPALGAALRGRLPGTAGVRWLHAEGLSPTVRASGLTPAPLLSLHATRRGEARGPPPRFPPA